VKISVAVEDHFDLLEAEIRQDVEEAMVEGGTALLEAIKHAETRVGDTNRGVWPGRHLQDSFVVTPVQRDGFGGRFLTIQVLTLDPNWRWQNYGTHARRRKKLAAGTVRRRQSASGQARYAKVAGSGGVKPLHFMSKGMRIAWPIFLELLKRKLPGTTPIGSL
jgi:hypothetical protein